MAKGHLPAGSLTAPSHLPLAVIEMTTSGDTSKTSFTTVQNLSARLHTTENISSRAILIKITKQKGAPRMTIIPCIPTKLTNTTCRMSRCSNSKMILKIR
jgi:hypothetical protein